MGGAIWVVGFAACSGSTGIGTDTLDSGGDSGSPAPEPLAIGTGGWTTADLPLLALASTVWASMVGYGPDCFTDTTAGDLFTVAYDPGCTDDDGVGWSGGYVKNRATGIYTFTDLGLDLGGGIVITVVDGTYVRDGDGAFSTWEDGDVTVRLEAPGLDATVDQTSHRSGGDSSVGPFSLDVRHGMRRFHATVDAPFAFNLCPTEWDHGTAEIDGDPDDLVFTFDGMTDCDGCTPYAIGPVAGEVCRASVRSG
ncbi:MAG: hypothetical protein ABMB14_36325 [Myxococcota bacterium]